MRSRATRLSAMRNKPKGWRYIYLLSFGNGARALSDFQVFSGNVNIATKATLSTNTNGTASLSNLVDGNTSTQFSASNWVGSTSYIRFDFGAPRIFERLTVFGAIVSGQAQEFYVGVSNSDSGAVSPAFNVNTTIEVSGMYTGSGLSNTASITSTLIP